MNSKRKTIYSVMAAAVMILSLVFPGGVSLAAGGLPSPFLGHWQAVDVDGSQMKLTIAGPPNGPFQITILDSYISFCDGEAGLIRGTGVLNPEDPNLLEVDVHLVCFTTGATLEIQGSWIYDEGTDTISDDDITWLRSSAVSKACTQPPYGLTGWWTGDEDARDIIAGRDGQLKGDAAVGSGLVDLAFTLDGDGDFVEVPDQPAFNVGINDFSVDLWVNFRDTDGEQVLVEKWIQSDLPIGWTLTKLESVDGNIIRLGIGDGIQGEVDVDTGELSLLPGIWYHFAAVRQANTITLYINGELVASNPDVPLMNLNSTTSLKFGHRGYPDDRGFFLNGRIDEVEFFANAALTAEQIKELYTAGSAGKCKDAVQPPPPTLELRVNYGHDWVESFYEAGHIVSVMVTENDGVTVKARADLVTGPREEWGGETGFQTFPEAWDPAPPDLQPYDWVYAWMDNGAFAQVQLGEISGVIDQESDTIMGTVNASWFTELVQLECLDWGSGNEPPLNNVAFGSLEAKGSETYSCHWDGWEIQPGQAIGVGYLGPDGHWVANAFVVPFLRAHPEWESVDGWFWAQDGALHLEIDDPGTSEKPDLSMDMPGEVDPNLGSVWFDFAGEYNLKPGDIVTMTDGVYTRKLIVSTITITSIDVDNDFVTGTAEAEINVRLPVPEEVIVLTNEKGDWTANFTTHIQPGTTMIAEVFDEDGDMTSFEVYIPNPHFTIFPEWEWFDGMEWPDGATVNISVNRDGVPVTDCVTSVVDVSGGFFNGGFPDGCDILVGDVVVFNDGMNRREHTVRYLAIDSVDVAENTVAGTANPYEMLHVWPHGYSEILAAADENGSWLVDFDDIGIDLQEGMCGRAQIYDEMGNGTAVDWCIPNPHFTIFPEWKWFDGMEWPDGATVTISVSRDGEPVTDCETSVMDVQGGFFNGGFPEGCDIVVGDVVTFFDGTTTRTHTIQNLAITAVDASANTVIGTADPGAQLHVWAHEYDQYGLQPTAGGDGIWTADFTSPDFDLQDGMCGRAQIYDPIGNATSIEWCAPWPP